MWQTSLFVFLWRLLPAQYKSIIKYIIHLLTGKCELERICEEQKGVDTNYVVTKRFEQSLGTSKQLASLLEENSNKETNITFYYLSRKFTDVDEVYGKIRNIKGKNSFTSEHSKKVCKTCLRHMINLNQSINYLDNLARTSFELSDTTHKNLLLSLWTTLKPNHTLTFMDDREELTSPDWKEIGFQGLHPKTDFRGMGMLGLVNLHRFVVLYTREAREMLEDVSDPTMWYPFAISGINITGILINMIRSHEIVEVFYGLNFEQDEQTHQTTTENIFQGLYNYVFINFHEYYVKNNGTVMKFNILLQEYLRQPSVQHALKTHTISPYSLL
ncbi:hypothetical protein C9374_007634 [Naegleria lovaniensis]|uniref:ELMO domain-containing protein n=1 Tax=Naegleria lovaniensis TaxID=51637 RepID=A0AA88GM69_NAELO|nr:uncharacterized protein C9374_007634 [Naegleria lovaniensis]KAG2378996.1 hypothetical protein C9374_007634 [Naegleria lovaniensis]